MIGINNIKLHHFLHVLCACLAAGSVALVSLIFVSTLNPQKAQATPGMVPFGGRILAFNALSVVTGCPPHTVIFDYVSLNNIGIAVMPSSMLYEYYNLFMPGAHVLGEYAPVPIPTCLTPYPVFPIFQVGTSATP